MEKMAKERGIVACLCMIFLLLTGSYLIDQINSYPRIEFESGKTRLTRDFSLFYLVKGMEDYDEAHRVNEKRIIETNKCIFYVNNIRMNNDRLRIDFGSNIGNVQIGSIKIRKLFLEKEIPIQFMMNCEFSDDVGKVFTEKEFLNIECIGDDPYIILDNLNAIDSTFYWNKVNICVICFLIIVILYRIITNRNIICITKKQAAIVSLILFFTHRISFLITHVGFFAFDEFFHVSTLNPDYITDYNRAVYINHIINVVCKIFGQSHLTVKIVPVTLGVISFACCLYLAYQLYDNPYWIINTCVIVTYMPYIAFNHFYIRMYVFVEAIFMLDCVLLYRAQQKVGTKVEKLYLIFSVIITGFYGIYTKDFSGKALMALLLVSIFCHICRSKSGLLKKGLLIKLGIALLSVGGIGVALIIRFFGFEVFGNMFTGNYEYRDNSPVLLKFIFVTIFYITIPFIISIICTWKKTTNGNTLYIAALLPLLGYAVVFYNGHMIRNYVAFLPIVCIMAYLGFDKIRLSALQHLIIIFCAIALTMHIEPDFWQTPRIPLETSYENLGKAVSRAKEFEEEGYELIALLPSKMHLAYFDIPDNAHLNMYLANLADLAEPVFKSDRKIVIVADSRGFGHLNETDWRMWGDGRYIEEKYAGGCGVIVLNGVSQ